MDCEALIGTVSEERDFFAPIHQAVEMELKAIESCPTGKLLLTGEESLLAQKLSLTDTDLVVQGVSRLIKAMDLNPYLLLTTDLKYIRLII